MESQEPTGNGPFPGEPRAPRAKKSQEETGFSTVTLGAAMVGQTAPDSPIPCSRISAGGGRGQEGENTRIQTDTYARTQPCQAQQTQSQSTQIEGPAHVCVPHGYRRKTHTHTHAHTPLWYSQNWWYHHSQYIWGAPKSVHSPLPKVTAQPRCPSKQLELLTAFE